MVCHLMLRYYPPEKALRNKLIPIIVASSLIWFVWQSWLTSRVFLQFDVTEVYSMNKTHINDKFASPSFLPTSEGLVI